jgi:hypothetical protein
VSVATEPLWILTNGGEKVLRVEDIDPPLTDAELESLRSRGYAFTSERDAVAASRDSLQQQWNGLKSRSDVCKRKLEAARERLRGLTRVSRHA